MQAGHPRNVWLMMHGVAPALASSWSPSWAPPTISLHPAYPGCGEDESYPLSSELESVLDLLREICQNK